MKNTNGAAVLNNHGATTFMDSVEAKYSTGLGRSLEDQHLLMRSEPNFMPGESVAKVRDFLGLFFAEGENICFRAIPPKGVPGAVTKHYGSIHALGNGVGLSQKLLRLNSSKGIYFVVNFGGDTDDSITRFNACFAENDTRTFEEQHRRLDAVPLPTTARVETSRSVHAYWRLHGSVDRDAWCEAQNRMIAFLAGDRSIKNPSRVMRVPEFEHIAKDGSRSRVQIVQFDPERMYPISELLAAFPATVMQKPILSVGLTGRTSYVSNRKSALPRAEKYLDAIPPAIAGQHGDDHTYKTCCTLVRDFGLSESEAFEILSSWNARCDPPWTERELQEKIRNAQRYGKQPIGRKLTEVRSPRPHNGNGRPAANDTPTSEQDEDTQDA